MRVSFASIRVEDSSAGLHAVLPPPAPLPDYRARPRIQCGRRLFSIVFGFKTQRHNPLILLEKINSCLILRTYFLDVPKLS